ncbi:FkbM family methyltransferase [Methylorubrum sp. Q1]|uniref:FkbM family methyltransferase n=1 Tax=Methylorubrum sp. Q1 TaxID=2562453 RepID=UPI001292BEE3|nr:FkbM family methyltransferase [Methylorubrum sp. Q1]
MPAAVSQIFLYEIFLPAELKLAGLVENSDEVGVFRDLVCRGLIEALKRRAKNNVDRNYPPIGAIASQNDFDEIRSKFLAFVTSNWDGLARTYNALEDAGSKELFISLILFKSLGHTYVRLPSNTASYWSARASSDAMPADPSEFTAGACGYEIERFSIPSSGRELSIECLRANIFFTFKMRQYYYERSEISVRPEAGDYVVDAGACFGDTAIDFAETVGHDGRVFSFDPLERHHRIIEANIARNEITNIVLFPSGLGKTDQPGSLVSERVDPGFADLSSVPMRSLDSLVSEGTVERVDFIKMDIEGHEMEALRGAEAAIRKFRPKLAISVYHRPQDYIEIPDYIRTIDPSYRLFLENYTISDGETILYCIAAP